MRWLSRGLVVLLAALVVLVGGAFAWLRSADPTAFAAAPVPRFRLATDDSYRVEQGGEARIYRDLEFVRADGAPLRVTLSLPVADAPAPLPVMVILGGLRSGRRSLQHLPAIGANAAIAFEYLYKDLIQSKDTSILHRIVVARRAALETPGQLTALLGWVRSRPWADRERVSLLGYSLGALFVPVASHKASLYGGGWDANILAFGGAHLGRIVPNSMKLETPVLRWLVGQLADALLKPIEPAYHLPHMRGPSLFIVAEEDELVPRASSEAMHRLAPEPKSVVTLPGEHIDPRDRAVLDSVVAITGEWLIDLGVVTPR